MRWALATAGFGVVSSVIPILNMEAYLIVLYARTDQSAWLLALAGSFGMNLGKLAWFYAARGALDLPWMRRRLEDPKRAVRVERWQQRIGGNPWLSAALTFVSAAVGFPPFFAMAVIAGSLRMNAAVFFFAGFLGRTLFFWVMLVGAGLLVR